MTSKEFTLTKPIKVLGEDVSVLTITEPTLGDLKVLDGYRADQGIAMTIALIAKMANIPSANAEQISVADLGRLKEECGDFFPS